MDEAASNVALSAVALEKARQAADRYSLWQCLLEDIQPRSMLEIGVWRGDFSAHLLSFSRSIERYFMIDPWRPLPDWNKPLNVSERDFEKAYEEAMARTEFAASKRIVLRGTTTETIDRIPDGSLDMVYVDGDHTLRGISIDLMRAFPKLRAGGWLCGDDFVPDIWQHGARFEPTLVFPFVSYFAEAVGARLYALPFDQFLLQKPDAGGGEGCFIDLVGRYGNRSLLHHLSIRKMLMKRFFRRLLRL